MASKRKALGSLSQSEANESRKSQLQHKKRKKKLTIDDFAREENILDIHEPTDEQKLLLLETPVMGNRSSKHAAGGKHGNDHPQHVVRNKHAAARALAKEEAERDRFKQEQQARNDPPTPPTPAGSIAASFYSKASDKTGESRSVKRLIANERQARKEKARREKEESKRNIRRACWTQIILDAATIQAQKEASNAAAAELAEDEGAMEICSTEQSLFLSPSSSDSEEDPQATVESTNKVARKKGSISHDPPHPAHKQASKDSLIANHAPTAWKHDDVQTVQPLAPRKHSPVPSDEESQYSGERSIDESKDPTSIAAVANEPKPNATGNCSPEVDPSQALHATQKKIQASTVSTKATFEANATESSPFERNQSLQNQEEQSSSKLSVDKGPKDTGSSKQSPILSPSSKLPNKKKANNSQTRKIVREENLVSLSTAQATSGDMSKAVHQKAEPQFLKLETVDPFDSLVSSSRKQEVDHPEDKDDLTTDSSYTLKVITDKDLQRFRETPPDNPDILNLMLRSETMPYGTRQNTRDQFIGLELSIFKADHLNDSDLSAHLSDDDGVSEDEPEMPTKSDLQPNDYITPKLFRDPAEIPSGQSPIPNETNKLSTGSQLVVCTSTVAATKSNDFASAKSQEDSARTNLPPQGVSTTDKNQPLLQLGEGETVSFKRWTAEVAGFTPVEQFFQLADGQWYLHDPLPHGWVVGVSKFRNCPYYSHPDLGRTFYPPTTLTSDGAASIRRIVPYISDQANVDFRSATDMIPQTPVSGDALNLQPPSGSQSETNRITYAGDTPVNDTSETSSLHEETSHSHCTQTPNEAGHQTERNRVPGDIGHVTIGSEVDGNPSPNSSTQSAQTTNSDLTILLACHQKRNLDRDTDSKQYCKTETTLLSNLDTPLESTADTPHSHCSFTSKANDHQNPNQDDSSYTGANSNDASNKMEILSNPGQHEENEEISVHQRQSKENHHRLLHQETPAYSNSIDKSEDHNDFPTNDGYPETPGDSGSETKSEERSDFPVNDAYQDTPAESGNKSDGPGDFPVNDDDDDEPMWSPKQNTVVGVSLVPGLLGSELIIPQSRHSSNSSDAKSLKINPFGDRYMGVLGHLQSQSSQSSQEQQSFGNDLSTLGDGSMYDPFHVVRRGASHRGRSIQNGSLQGSAASRFSNRVLFPPMPIDILQRLDTLPDVDERVVTARKKKKKGKTVNKEPKKKAKTTKSTFPRAVLTYK
jgi:hypothetical protein